MPAPHVTLHRLDGSLVTLGELAAAADAQGMGMLLNFGSMT